MAKKEEMSFGDLDNVLSKISPLGGMITTNVFSTIDEWIPTGNYMLNAQLTGSLSGGYPNSRSICIAGDSGCLPKDEKVRVYIMKTKNFNRKKNVE